MALLGVLIGSGVAAQTSPGDPWGNLPLSTGQASEAPGGQFFPVPQVAPPASPLLTVDWEGLYQRSAWGQRVARDIAVAGGDLTRENNRVTEELTAEERDLTKRRAGMAPADFRAAADAFDSKVVGIRRAQETKSRAIAALADEERRAFISAALPLLDTVLVSRGATAVIDARVIIRSLVSLDVTEDMVTLADQRLGDGAGRVDAARAAAAASAPAAERQNGATVPTAPDAGGANPPAAGATASDGPEVADPVAPATGTP